METTDLYCLPKGGLAMKITDRIVGLAFLYDL
jgi:hypothetical protein